MSKSDRPDETPAEIIERLRDKFIWLPRQEALQSDFNSLFEQTQELRHRSEAKKAQRVGEGRALVVVGESGEGKTRSLTRIFATHPQLPAYGIVGEACPVITIQAPSPCTLQQLGRATLAKLGYPIARDMRAHLVWERVNEKLKATKTSIIHFDEMQHATQTANILEVQKVANTLKALMVNIAWPVSLVISGIPQLVPFIEEDAQLRRRCEIVFLEPFIANIPNKKMIAEQARGLIESAGLTLETANATDLGSKILSAGGKHFGVIIELILASIRKALERSRLERRNGGISTNSVTIADFAAAHFQRTGSADTANPFIALDYAAIHPGRILQDTALASSAATQPPSAPKPGRRKKR